MKVTTSLILIFLSITLFSQELPRKYGRTIDKGDVLYNAFAYVKAIEQYKRALEISDEKWEYPTLRIADSYRQINDSEHALLWYEKVDTLPIMTNRDKANYAQVLILNGRYLEAKAIADSLGTSLDRLDRADQAVTIKIDTTSYFMENLAVNSVEGDFSPAYFQGGIAFVSNREFSRLLQNKYYWDESFYLDLYFTQNTDSTEDFFSRFHKRINTIYHEGPATFYDGDQKMIFTRNNFNKGRRKLSDEGVNKLKLFYTERDTTAIFKKETWAKPVEMPFNNDEYSVGHPTITSDGKRLYFASDMPGSYGDADIYYADFLNGEWSLPKNLGNQVNTTAEELFPFIYQDSILFFASKGHLGFGGLDLYKVNLNDPLSTPINLGGPLNSAYDDFGLIMDDNTGYFSSNRPGGKGGDDIYYFIYTEYIPPVPTYIVAVRAVNSETLEIIPDATVVITDSLSGERIVTKSLIDSTKYYKTFENMAYKAVGRHPKYFSNTILFPIGENLDVDTLFFEIPLEEIHIGKPIELENIYYDLDKSEIRDDAAFELDKLVQVLVDNPGIKIELSSHTDSRGSDSYNMRLSQRRAESAVAYIIENGISSDRITAKGYGETKLVNHCSNGVDCTKEEHQRNRRTEFSVTENTSGVEVIEHH